MLIATRGKFQKLPVKFKGKNGGVTNVNSKTKSRCVSYLLSFSPFSFSEIWIHLSFLTI